MTSAWEGSHKARPVSAAHRAGRQDGGRGTRAEAGRGSIPPCSGARTPPTCAPEGAGQNRFGSIRGRASGPSRAGAGPFEPDPRRRRREEPVSHYTGISSGGRALRTEQATVRSWRGELSGLSSSPTLTASARTRSRQAGGRHVLEVPAEPSPRAPGASWTAARGAAGRVPERRRAGRQPPRATGRRCRRPP